MSADEAAATSVERAVENADAQVSTSAHLDDVVVDPDERTGAQGDERESGHAPSRALDRPKEYDDGEGNLLQFTYTTSAADGNRKKRVVYHPLVVTPQDSQALMMHVECDESEKECAIAVCRNDIEIKGAFAEFFQRGEVLKPIRPPGGIVRLCICPKHRQATLASPMMDAAKCAARLPSLDGSGATGWRAVMENGDSYVRCFSVHRTDDCLCALSVAFST